MKGEILALIMGMALVTFIPRFLPMALLTRWVVPERVKMGLDYVPISIFSAIVFPILFFDKKGIFAIQPQILIAAIPIFVFAWKVRSLWGSVVLGMAIYWGMGFVL